MEILRKDSWNQQYAEEKVKKTLIDLLFYMVFLFVVSISTLKIYLEKEVSEEE